MKKNKILDSVEHVAKGSEELEKEVKEELESAKANKELSMEDLLKMSEKTIEANND